MPKRAHGRPAKSKNRTRRTSLQSNSYGVMDSPVMEQEPPIDPGVTTAARPATSVSSATAASQRRSPASLRKAPAVTINYRYLNRDIKTLAILAPSMVVLLVLAFVLFH